METLPRYSIIGLLQLISGLAEITSKLLLIGGFAIASFTFYYSCLLFFKSKVDIQNISFKIAAILASLFHAYNVVISQNRSLAFAFKDYKRSSLEGVKYNKGIGLFKIFKIGNKKIGQVKIPVQSSLIVGGLDKFGSLNFAIHSIAASSLLFLDQQIKGELLFSSKQR